MAMLTTAIAYHAMLTKASLTRAMPTVAIAYLALLTMAMLTFHLQETLAGCRRAALAVQKEVRRKAF